MFYKFSVYDNVLNEIVQKCYFRKQSFIIAYEFSIQFHIIPSETANNSTSGTSLPFFVTF